MLKRELKPAVFPVVLLFSANCSALGSYSPAILGALTDSEVNSLVETVAIGSSYRPIGACDSARDGIWF